MLPVQNQQKFLLCGKPSFRNSSLAGSSPAIFAILPLSRVSKGKTGIWWAVTTGQFCSSKNVGRMKNINRSESTDKLALHGQLIKFVF